MPSFALLFIYNFRSLDNFRSGTILTFTLVKKAQSYKTIVVRSRIKCGAHVWVLRMQRTVSTYLSVCVWRVAVLHVQIYYCVKKICSIVWPNTFTTGTVRRYSTHSISRYVNWLAVNPVLLMYFNDKYENWQHVYSIKLLDYES